MYEPIAPGAKHEKKVQKKPKVAAQNVCMCGFLKVQRMGKKTVDLCSALTGHSNFLPSMSVTPRELMPLSSHVLCSLRGGGSARTSEGKARGQWEA